MALPEHASHIPHISLPDIGRGTARWALDHWPALGGAALTLTGAGLAYQLFTGADRGPQTTPTEPTKASDTFKPPEGGTNVGIVTNPPAEPTPPSEAQKPPTEAMVETTPCSILSPELCRTAELIELPPNAEGQSLRYVGLNPPENTELLMPITGQALKVTNPKGFNGNRVVAFRLDNPRFAISITGDLGFKSDRTENKTQGEPVAVAKDTGIKNFGYRILFTASEFNDKDQTVTADRVIYELFPQLSNKTPRKVTPDENPLLSLDPTKSTPIFLDKKP